MICKNAKRIDQGWECTVAKKAMQMPYSRSELMHRRVQMD